MRSIDRLTLQIRNMSLLQKIFSLLTISILFFSCQKDVNATEDLIVPETSGIDVNDDGAPEFEVDYSIFVWDGVSGSGSGSSGSILPIDISKSSLLLSQDHSNLFLEQGDTIRTTLGNDLRWGIRQFFTSISDINSNGAFFPEEWDVICNSEFGCSYIGFKVQQDDQGEEIGFMEIIVNRQTGELIIENIVTTAANELVIF